MDMMITKREGTSRLSDMGVFAKDFIISSVGLEFESEFVEGRDGSFDMGSVFSGRRIVVPFYFESVDLLDFPLQRDQLYRFLLDKESYYIHEMRRPKELNYDFVSPSKSAKPIEDKHELSKKRYLVRLSSEVNIEQTLKMGEGELVFEVVGLPLAESYGTTLDPFTFTSEKWQVGQGVIAEDASYVHNTSTFRIYNGSDIPIDPRQIPLKIKYQGASDKLKIKNNTTGDEWQFNGTSSTNDTILLDGVRSLKNGLTIFGQTNRKLITLAEGWNDFSITGASGSFLISFDFRFHTI